MLEFEVDGLTISIFGTLDKVLKSLKELMEEIE
jgi:hypothetical protein